MKTFVIRDTIACKVTWSYTVEAETESEAMQRFRDGDHDAPLQLPEIGDCIEYVPQETEIEESAA